jgi:hypothetical protein
VNPVDARSANRPVLSSNRALDSVPRLQGRRTPCRTKPAILNLMRLCDQYVLRVRAKGKPGGQAVYGRLRAGFEMGWLSYACPTGKSTTGTVEQGVLMQAGRSGAGRE